MTIAVIGSIALNYHIPNFRVEPKDTDLVMTYETFTGWHDNQKNVRAVYPINSGKKFVVEFNDNRIYEIELAKPGNSAMMILEMSDSFHILQEETADFLVPPVELLLAIKLSHRYLKNSPFFNKTMDDISRLKSRGVSPAKYAEFIKIREKETYDYSLPRLNQSKQDFFNGDAVKYVYDHDSLHEVVKIGVRPAYSYFKPADKEVMVSRSMFVELPYDIQINSVLEESYVLALERSQIPFKNKVSAYTSFRTALFKVCTSITSGWWREFAYDNYYTVLSRYDDKYVDKFNKALEKGGIVKPHSGKTY